MLSHLSVKFQRDATEESHEPRAALFLNRFTRTLTIMYATNGIEQIIGISGEEMKGRSFYYCIAQNCLEDAVKCLETAKGNDSIAYLLFWFRDPRQDDPPASDTTSEPATEDAIMTDVEDEGGVRLDAIGPDPNFDESTSASVSTGPGHTQTAEPEVEAGASRPTPGHPNPHLIPGGSHDDEVRTSSGESQAATAAIFDRPNPAASAQSSAPTSPSVAGGAGPNPLIELEAVVSCTSDGLVVILRRARPLIPGTVADASPPGRPAVASPPRGVGYPHGVFAAPWGAEPVFIPEQPRPEPGWYHGMQPSPGPSPQDFLNSIREVAVFAWALVGINGNLVDHGRGRPEGEALPHSGLPIWSPQWPGQDSGNASLAGTEGGTPTVFSGGPGRTAH